MDPHFSAETINGFQATFLRHSLTFACIGVWRYTLAGFNFIIHMLELVCEPCCVIKSCDTAPGGSYKQ